MRIGYARVSTDDRASASLDPKLLALTSKKWIRLLSFASSLTDSSARPRRSQLALPLQTRFFRKPTSARSIRERVCRTVYHFLSDHYVDFVGRRRIVPDKGLGNGLRDPGKQVQIFRNLGGFFF